MFNSEGNCKKEKKIAQLLGEACYWPSFFFKQHCLLVHVHLFVVVVY